MLPFKRLFIAARGSAAIRLAKAARRAHLIPVAAFVPADRDASWTGYFADLAPVSAYNDPRALVAAAQALQADAVHPGVGFMAESSEFAALVQQVGLTWVGPAASVLEKLADKSQLAQLAQNLGVALPATSGIVQGTAQIAQFATAHGWPLILKTTQGGGGSGVTVLADMQQAELAWKAGEDSVPRLLQQAVPQARHIEVQALGDGSGLIHTLGTRECTVQRRCQKLFAEAPAVGLSAQTVELLESATRAVLGAVDYQGIATCEFLLPGGSDPAHPLLLEVNARLQVEHAVTEAVSGLDLAAAQLALAAGDDVATVLAGQASISTLTGDTPAAHAAQVRLYAELAGADFAPSTGVVTALSIPLSVAGARAQVERSVITGDLVRPEFSDPLALITVAACGRDSALTALRKILTDTVLFGVDSLRDLLLLLLADDAFTNSPSSITTRWLEETALPHYLQAGLLSAPAPSESPAAAHSSHPDRIQLRSQLAATVAVSVAPGQPVQAGELVAVLEAMKMRLPVVAPQAGTVESVLVQAGKIVEASEVLAVLRTAAPASATHHENAPADSDQAPVATVPPRAHPTASERVRALADPGSLHAVHNEDAVLTCRAQITGRDVLIWAQDATVRGGSIGLAGSRRVAALIDEAARTHTPIFALLDSGGARIQEGVDALAGVGLILRACTRARGQVLHTALVLGAAAGGAAYAPALADVVVMVQDQSALFLTGPSVVQAATGERVSAQELGGAQVHAAHSGSCHLTVASETAAWRAARQLLSFAPRYFDQQVRLVVLPGGLGTSPHPTDRPTSEIVPLDPAQTYDVHQLLARLTDRSEWLELRPDWAPHVVTALAHVGGLPVGVVANQPQDSAGALDTLASQKIAEHVQLCSDLHLPLLTIVDTPGFLPGATQEAAGAIRQGAKVVAAYAGSRSRLVTLITRKAYGGAFVALGSQALSKSTVLAWPQARLGVMDAVSAVSITRRRDLQSAGESQTDLFNRLVSEQEELESAPRAQQSGWVEDIVSPTQTRARLTAELGRDAVLSTNMRLRHPGDGWVQCGCGKRHWGLHGAAGTLVWRLRDGQLQVLLQLRAGWTHSGGTWGLPGGAIASGEDAVTAALRECEEETGLPGYLLEPGAQHEQSHPDWAYTTVVARAPADPAWDYLPPVDGESDALEWVSVNAERQAPSDRTLLPALAKVWDELLTLVPPLNAGNDAV